MKFGPIDNAMKFKRGESVAVKVGKFYCVGKYIKFDRDFIENPYTVAFPVVDFIHDRLRWDTIQCNDREIRKIKRLELD